MKLTEDTVIIETHDYEENQVSFKLFEVKADIQQQILDNQKIVDGILEYYKDAKSKEWFATDEYCNTINGIIQDATGKDIGELKK